MPRTARPVKTHAKAVIHRVTTHVPVAQMTDTIRAVRASISKGASGASSINYVYVLDKRKRLIGVLSLKDLFRLPSTARVGNVCRKKPLVTVTPHMHQERAVYLALKHNIKAVPVVDDSGAFKGVISSDTILGILHKEVHEDMLRLAGVSRKHRDPFDNILTLPLRTTIRHRLPWLILGLLGGLLGARIIGSYEHVLQRQVILAAFIPLVVYMGGAAAVQIQAFMIRDLAMHHALPLVRYFFRQLSVLAILALVCSSLVGVAVSVMYEDMQVGIILGVSLFAAIVSSIFTGLFIPLLFSHLKMDPANASGPVTTIAQDLLCILIYFGTASTMLL